MLWIEPCSMFYAGALGGMLGAVSMSLIMKRSQNEYRNVCERLWTDDICKIRNQIHDLICEVRGMSEVKISPQTLDNIVNKRANHNEYKGYKGGHKKNQGGRK